VWVVFRFPYIVIISLEKVTFRRLKMTFSDEKVTFSDEKVTFSDEKQVFRNEKVVFSPANGWSAVTLGVRQTFDIFTWGDAKLMGKAVGEVCYRRIAEALRHFANG